MLRKIIKRIFRFFGIKISVTAQILEISKLSREVKKYSNLDEESIIKRYLKELQIEKSFVVDIAAGDGVGMSNIYALYKEGWPGVAAEYDSIAFSNLSKTYRDIPSVNLIRIKITPQNVNHIFEACSVPIRFSFLNLDIDGYDYYVLDPILVKYRPSLICAEINENIPPPIRFTVIYDANYSWAKDHFYGQSISQLYLLCEKYKYDLVKLHYNSAFLIPSEINKYKALTPGEAYDKGYRLRNDRKEKFPQNKDMESVLEMIPNQAVKFLTEKFKEHKGKYIMEH